MDIKQFGYTTTIGLAQFHEQLLNRVTRVIEPIAKHQGDRPAILRTGKRGRPSKAKMTKKSTTAIVNKA
jgi:hypothetical protein